MIHVCCPPLRTCGAIAADSSRERTILQANVWLWLQLHTLTMCRRSRGTEGLALTSRTASRWFCSTDWALLQVL